MIKTLLSCIVAFVILFVVVQYGQESLFKDNTKDIRFDLFKTNLFFALTSIGICILFEILSNVDSQKSQLGFIYLPTLFLKGLLFLIVFKSTIFNLETLTTAERFNLLIPLLLFLGLEVFFMIKILKKSEPI